MPRSRHNINHRDDVPLCTRCLQPHDPLVHYCPHCGCTVGQLTPYMPFVSIPFEVDFLNKLWKRIWASDTHPMMRIFCMLLVLFFAPLLLLGLPFILIKLRKKHSNTQRGFDALLDTEKKLADNAAVTDATNPQPPDAGLS